VSNNTDQRTTFRDVGKGLAAAFLGPALALLLALLIYFGGKQGNAWSPDLLIGRLHVVAVVWLSFYISFMWNQTSKWPRLLVSVILIRGLILGLVAPVQVFVLHGKIADRQWAATYEMVAYLIAFAVGLKISKLRRPPTPAP
jgi:hypothetical protein